MPGRAGLLYSDSSLLLLYTSPSQMKSLEYMQKKKKKKVSCFTVFRAPLELNYVGTLTCSLSAKRWQIPVAQFERCVVKHNSFALALQVTVWHALCKPQVPTAACGFLAFLTSGVHGSQLLDPASSVPMHTAL